MTAGSPRGRTDFLRLLVLLTAATLLLLPFVAARAETATATLNVSVQVLPHVRVATSSAPVVVTAADLARGYVDVSRGYVLETNALDRVVLQLNPRLGLTESVDVRGLQAPLQLLDEGIEVTTAPARRFTLQYRLWLDPAAAPGTYELPVQLAASVR